MATIGMIDNARIDIGRNYRRLGEIEAKLDKVLTIADALLQKANHTGANFLPRGLSLQEARRYVGGISRDRMYKLINDGSIKRSFLIGNRRYVFREELDSFMESRIDREGERGEPPYRDGAGSIISLVFTEATEEEEIG
jgi:predicted DNA-binding transcriptional regulator AlpA